MIKINLLPAHVLERRQVRRLVRTFLALLIVEIIAIAAVSVLYGQKASAWEEQALAYQGLAEVVRGVKTDTDKLKAETDPLQAWVDFAHDVDTHNADYAKTLAEIARYIHPKAALKSLEIKDSAVTLTVNVDKPTTAGQTWLNLRRCPALSAVNVTSKIPGWSGGDWGGWVPMTGQTGTPSGTLPGTIPGTMPGTTPGTMPGGVTVQVSERRGFDVTFGATLTPSYTPKAASPPGGEPAAAAGGVTAGAGPGPMGPMGGGPGGPPTPEGMPMPAGPAGGGPPG